MAHKAGMIFVGLIKHNNFSHFELNHVKLFGTGLRTDNRTVADKSHKVRLTTVELSSQED